MRINQFFLILIHLLKCAPFLQLLYRITVFLLEKIYVLIVKYKLSIESSVQTKRVPTRDTTKQHFSEQPTVKVKLTREEKLVIRKRVNTWAKEEKQRCPVTFIKSVLEISPVTNTTFCSTSCMQPYYAVRRGWKTGVYTNWPITSASTKHFPNAMFKKFQSEQYAWEYVSAPDDTAAFDIARKYSNSSS
jgi:hypothetical protein